MIKFKTKDCDFHKKDENYKYKAGMAVSICKDCDKAYPYGKEHKC